MFCLSENIFPDFFYKDNVDFPNHQKKFSDFNIYFMDIKKFEDFSDSGMEYLKCSDCGSAYPAYRPKFQKCRYCGSKNVNQMEEDKYYDEIISTEDPEELKDILTNRKIIGNVDGVRSTIRSPHYLTNPNNLNWIGKD